MKGKETDKGKNEGFFFKRHKSGDGKLCIVCEERQESQRGG